MSRPLLLCLLAAGCPDPDPIDTTEPDSDTQVELGSEGDSDTTVETGVCEPQVVTLPFTLTGDTWFGDFANDGDFSVGQGCTAAAGAEVSFEVDLVGGTTFTVVEAGGADVVIHVKERCATDAACLVSADDTTRDRLDYAVPSTGTYVIIVEGWSENANGDYALTLATIGVEVCDDDVDNDLNGAIDCADAACIGTEACPFECPSTPLVLPFAVSGDDFTVDFPSAVRFADLPDCGNANGGEAVFELDMTAGQQVQIAENGPLDAVVRVLDVCDDDGVCLASVDYGDALRFTAPADGTYTLVVEGSSASPSTFSSAYDIRIDEISPEHCDDAVDNDLDGQVDCDDVDCFDTVQCPFECPAEPLPLTDGLFSVIGQDFAADASEPLPYALGASCSSGSGGVLAWDIVLDAGESLRVNEVGSMNAVWRVQSDCLPTSACLISESNDTGVAFTADHSGGYTLILQSSSAVDNNPYEVYVRRIPAEDCAALGDEDLDGLADCADADCAASSLCAFECGDTEVTDVLTVAGDDFGADWPNTWNYGAGTGCDVGSGAEALFTLDLLAGQSVRVTESGPVDVALHILDTCLPERPCLASTGSPETLEYTAVDDGVYTVVVEGRSTSTDLAYDIRIERLEPERCDDAVDNDVDGTSDCDDPDCFGDAVDCTVETTCFDGADNDADGFIDCDDDDCIGAVGCGGGSERFSEDFETWPPSGWTVDDEGSAGLTWMPCDAPGCTDILTQWTSFQGGIGQFAYVNSDDPGFGFTFDERLTSPVVDLSGASRALLTFDHLFDSGGGDTASVEVSHDGLTWTPVRSWTSDTVNGEAARVSLNQVAGSGTAQLRFRYRSQRDWFWAIDSVVIIAD